MPCKKPSDIKEVAQYRSAVGLAIQEFRSLKNVPVTIFARSIGMKYCRVWQYEKGQSLPSLHVLLNIIQKLGCDETTFFARVRHYIEIERNTEK